MARKKGGIASFFDGFNTSYDSIGRVLQDAEMRKVMNASVQTDTGYTPEQGADLEAAAQSGQYDVNFDQDKGAYTVTPKAGGEAGTIAPGQRHSFMGALQAQPFTQAQQDRARMTGISDVLAKHGDPVKAMQLRQMANQTDMQDVQKRSAEQQIALAGRQDERAQATHSGQMEKQGIDLEKAKEEQARAARIKSFHGAVQGLRKSGKNPTLAEMRQIAAQQGLDDGDLFTIGTQFTGMNELEAKSEAQARIQGFDKAFQGGGLEGVRKLYDEDALFNNGRKMTITRDKKSGAVTVLDNGNPIFSGANETEAAAFMRKQLTDPIGAVSFAYEVKKAQSGLKKDEADIAQSRAATAASGATIDTKRRADTDKKAAQDAAVALAREQNPGLTKVQEAAIRTGVLDVFKRDEKSTHIPVKDDMGQTEGVMVFQGGKPSGFFKAEDVKSGRNAPVTGPKIGERRTINGTPAEWDGKGWRAVK